MWKVISMNIIPNNNPEKKVKNPRLSFQPCTSGRMVQPPYFQNYYPFANYLNAPLNDCYGVPKQKKSGKLATALKVLAGGVAGFMAFRFILKNSNGIKNFFTKLIGK